MHRPLLTVVLAFACVTWTSAANAQAPQIPRLSTPVTVKVGGATGSMSMAGVYVALAKGYFHDAGITNEFISLQGVNELLVPLATGELDLGTAGPGAALFNAIERGIRLKIVADQNTAFPGRSSIAFMVRKDLIDSGQVKTYADLRGRTVALANRRATMELDLLKLLRMGGLTLNDIKLVIMPFPQMTAAYASKVIDASFMLEPVVTATVSQNLAVRWKAHDEITPYRQNSFLVMSEKFSTRTDVVRAWMVAYVRGLHDYNDAVVKNQGREAVIQALMQHTTVKTRATYERMALPGIHPDGELSLDSIREALAEFRAAGDIKTDIDLDKVIDLSFVRYAQKVLGLYRP